MPSKIATLRERFFALQTLERSLPSVLSEVISQVAALFEHAVALVDPASEVQFYSVSHRVSHLYSLVPHFRNMFK